MRTGVLFVAGVTSRGVDGLYATMKGAAPRSNILQSQFDRLRNNPKELLIFDGGTGEELFRQGVPDDRKIWSATAVVNPQYHSVLKQVHQSFVAAGSQAITTNSYGVVPGVGFTLEEIVRYVATAGRIARESVSEDSATLVMGSLGPLQESYRPDLILPHDQGVAIYSQIQKALSPYVDCFLAETMSSYEECIQAVEAVNTLTPGHSRPIMTAFTLDGQGNFRSGEAVTDGIRRLLDFVKKHQQVELLAILFNCSEPEAITLALQRIHNDLALRQVLTEEYICLGAYANRLTPVASDWTLKASDAPQPMRDDLSPQGYYDKFVSQWLSDYNVQLIGGCCGITPDHIAYLTSEQQKRC